MINAETNPQAYMWLLEALINYYLAALRDKKSQKVGEVLSSLKQAIGGNVHVLKKEDEILWY